MGTGECRIRGLLTSDDTQRCMEALTLLHQDGEAAFEWVEGGKELIVRGSGGKLRVPSTELYLGNSGTSARFLTGVATVVESPGGSVVVTGNKRMKVKPKPKPRHPNPLLPPRLEAYRGEPSTLNSKP